MCGIAGFFGPPSSEDPLRPVAAAMAAALVHRGPDAGGVWVDGSAGVALAHRRLSILDPSPEGHQPMASASGRFRIALNGEIYNHGALRAELASCGHRFRGRSDTEVVLAAFEQWDVAPAFERFVGMFALALWDRVDHTLWLARDRLGEKPLYYGWLGDSLAFASELKALRLHPHWKQALRRDAVALFLRYGYVPAPHSIYEGVYKLPPGCLLAVRAPAAQARRDFSPHATARGAPAPTAPVTWWSARDAAHAGLRDPLVLPPEEAVARLDVLLRDAVTLQRVADVPLGALLSGGVDSTMIVALMQEQSSRPVDTYSIGFREEGYDEAGWAREISRHLGTRHHELYVDAGEALATIPSLPQLYDEPLSDAAQIPMLLLARLARGGVTVALSGDGGDELFGGYERYARANAFWRALRWIPQRARGAAARALARREPGVVRALAGRVLGGGGAVLPRLAKLARALDAADTTEVYRRLVSHWLEPAALVYGAREPSTIFDDATLRVPGASPIETMMQLDTMTYLPDDVLVKVDRASMAVGLEVRAPFLDHRVFEFAWRIPLAQKLRARQGKWLLRQLLYRHVPAALVNRPKQGFEVPIGGWLRGVLREWAEALLDERRLRDQGLLDPTPIRRRWSEHLSGRCDWQWQLWDVLVLQAWLDEWGEG